MNLPLVEADLQAYVDDQLPQERRREIEAYLATRPEEAERLRSYAAHKREIRTLFDPVLDEPVPRRLVEAAAKRRPWYLQRIAAGGGEIRGGGDDGHRALLLRRAAAVPGWEAGRTGRDRRR